ncbi:hypothetical protein [Actinocorallia longicatena]|uniref:DUF998 domain-containing protein n=1 Tax=Actinocorallia longicatena TaxID=111803 RepID=A0ABP6QCY9_9ACTN
MTAHSQPRLATSAPRPLPAALAGLGAVLLLIAPLGPGWLFSPANPAAGIPAITLSFADLHRLTSSGPVPTNWIQENYFSWLGWALIAVTILTTAAGVLLRRRELNSTAAALAALGIVLTVLAAKGTLTWSQFSDETPHIRVGVYLLQLGYVLMIAAAATAQKRR